jgi:hypothetical protein
VVREHPITKWLSNGNNIFPTIYLSLVSFLTYACMYGIRKPFAVAEFQGIIVWGMDYKALLIISQVIGYALSKFLGIKIVSEMKRKQRAISIIMFTGMAELSLILFDIVPKPYNIIFLFLNGLPLGMIWGLVFAYLEGRKTTEILGTVLSISFIVSSGFVKTIGEIMITRLHLSDFQMPWVTGLVFFLPMLVLVWLLDKAPEPCREDILLRSKRVPMDHEQRLVIFREFAAGLIALTLAYMLLTIFRDLRDNFAVEIWKSIGYSGSSMIFTLSELPIAIIVFAVMSSVMLIRNNALALQINHLIVLSGFLTIGISTILLQTGLITPIAWMIMLGLGTYLGYLPFNCLLFDRLIAAFGSVANAGFFIYVADSFGYLGSVGTLIFKNFINKELSWFGFLVTSSFGVSIAGTMLIVFSVIYLSIKHNRTSGKTVVLEDLYIDTFTV